MHEKGIFHRDLKPENILLEKKDDPVRTIKIIDFGIAIRFVSGQRFPSNHSSGTVRYMSPEQLVARRSPNSRANDEDGEYVLFGRLNGGKVEDYNEKTDMWAIGIIAYFLLTGELPLPNKDD